MNVSGSLLRALLFSLPLSITATVMATGELNSFADRLFLGFIIQVYFFPTIFLMTEAREVLLKPLKRNLTGMTVYTSLLLLPYIVYAVWFQLPLITGLIRYLILFSGIIAILFLSPSRRFGVNFQYLFMILCIWVPFEIGWFVPVWSYPGGHALYFINVIIGLNFVMFLFPGFLGYKGLDMIWRLDSNTLKLHIVLGSMLFPLAISFGIMSGFLALKDDISWAMIPLHLTAMFLFVALPEEVLFRGLLQNQLQRMLPSKWLPLILTSLVFGVSHLNNIPAGDYRYVVVATMAGLSFGFLYQKTSSVVEAAILHTFVNTIQELLFAKVSL